MLSGVALVPCRAAPVGIHHTIEKRNVLRALGFASPCSAGMLLVLWDLVCPGLAAAEDRILLNHCRFKA